MTPKTRSAAAKACWMVLLEPDSRRRGVKTMNIAAKNEKNAPGVMSPLMTSEPPYQIMTATPTTPITSIWEEPNEDTWMAFIVVLRNARLLC